MSSTATNIHAPGFVFPGETFGHVHRFPTITVQGKNNPLKWTIYCGLVTEKIANTSIQALNGRVGDDIISGFASYAEPIEPHYFNHNELPLVAFTVVDSHQVVKGKDEARFLAMSFVAKGKNLTKSNKTNCFTQAMYDAYSKFNKKLATDLFEPMLANGTAVAMSELDSFLSATVTEKLFVQRKYDGVRMLVCESLTYSRGGKEIHLKGELKVQVGQLIARLQKSALTPPGHRFYLDGELYKHGSSLSEISGAARGGDGDLEYWVYDCFILDEFGKPTDHVFKQREKILRHIERKNAEYPLVRFAPTLYYGDNPAKVKKAYLEALGESYEGVILRLNVKYNNANRSSMIKLKELLCEEFRVVGFEQGVGKMEKTILYICETTEKSIDSAKSYLAERGQTWDCEKPKRFTVSPIGPLEERRAMFKKMHKYENEIKVFDLYYKNRSYTVQFNNWSRNLVPMCPIGVGFRDF
jgi:hypothetical protein